MATKSEADQALAYHQNILFQSIPDLTKISVVESKPHSGDFLLEAGVIDLRTANQNLGPVRIPTELQIPGSSGHFPNKTIRVRVVETGELKRLSGVFTSRTRPAQGGDSVGRAGGPDTGTLGSTVQLKVGGNSEDYFLSCWHVLVGGSGRLGDSIIQPGPGDTGLSPGDDIGELYWYLLDSEFDVAIAKTSKPPSLHLNVGCRCTSCSNSTPAAPILNSVVAKCGRTSGLTLGLILSDNATIRLPGYPTGLHLFTHQIETTAMAWPADSGSILFNYDNNTPVGLLLGGGDSKTYHNNLDSLFSHSFAARIETYPDGSSDSLPGVDFVSL